MAGLASCMITFAVLIVCPIDSSDRANRLLSIWSISARDMRVPCVIARPLSEYDRYQNRARCGPAQWLVYDDQLAATRSARSRTRKKNGIAVAIPTPNVRITDAIHQRRMPRFLASTTAHRWKATTT